MIATEYIIFGTIIIAILLFFILTLVPLPFGGTHPDDKGHFDLNVRNILPTLSKENIFQTNNSASFQGFVYLTNIQKTATATPCTTTDESGSDPNCTTGRYAFCRCDETNCSTCITNGAHNGYIPLFNINEVCILEILGAPDASRQGRASAQLVIKTELAGNASGNAYNSPATAPATNPRNIYIETFVLPTIPFQKWTMITISRDGRRYDIYYNNRLVLSKYSSAMLYTSGTLTKDVVAGHTSLDGTCGFFTMYKTIQSAESIARTYNSFISTRGDPIFDINPPTFTLGTLPNLSIPSAGIPSLCSSGGCIDSITLPSANPMYEWT